MLCPCSIKPEILGQFVWWGRQESNLQPVDYEPNALTIELRPLRLRFNTVLRSQGLVEFPQPCLSAYPIRQM